MLYLDQNLFNCNSFSIYLSSVEFRIIQQKLMKVQDNCKNHINSQPFVQKIVHEQLIGRVYDQIHKYSRKTVNQCCIGEFQKINNSFLTLSKDQIQQYPPRCIQQVQQNKNLPIQFFVKTIPVYTQKKNRIKKKQLKRNLGKGKLQTKNRYSSQKPNYNQFTQGKISLHHFGNTQIIRRTSDLKRNSISTITEKKNVKFSPLQQPNIKDQFTSTKSQLQKIFRDAKERSSRYSAKIIQYTPRPKRYKQNTIVNNNKKNTQYTTDYEGKPISINNKTNIKHYIDVDVQIIDKNNKSLSKCEDIVIAKQQYSLIKPLAMNYNKEQHESSFSKCIIKGILQKSKAVEEAAGRNGESKIHPQEVVDSILKSKKSFCYKQNKYLFPKKISLEAFQKIKKKRLHQQIRNSQTKQAKCLLTLPDLELTKQASLHKKKKNDSQQGTDKKNEDEQKIIQKITLRNNEAYSYLLELEEKKIKKKVVTIDPIFM